MILYESNRFADAIKVYDDMLRTSHNSYLLKVRNLALYSEKGLQSFHSTPVNYTGARDYFAKVLSIVPNDPEALNNEGISLFHLKNKTALKYFDKAISLNSSDIDTLWNKANALLEFGNNTGAVSVFTKVLQLRPNDPAANDDMGVALFNLDNKTALTFFNKAIALNTTDSNAWFNRGALLQSWGDYKGAISYYEKALQLNHNDKDARQNLAQAKSQLFGSMCCKGGIK
jgi:tetratricopeptide (TPR) repeat protein